MPQEHPPNRFLISYDDGDKELRAENYIKQWLMKVTPAQEQAKAVRIRKRLMTPSVYMAELSSLDLMDRLEEEVYRDEAVERVREQDYAVITAGSLFPDAVSLCPPERWWSTDADELASAFVRMGCALREEDVVTAVRLLTAPAGVASHNWNCTEPSLTWLLKQMTLGEGTIVYVPWIADHFVWHSPIGVKVAFPKKGTGLQHLHNEDWELLRDQLGSIGLAVITAPPKFLDLIVPSLEVVCSLGYCLIIHTEDLLGSRSRVLVAALRNAVAQDRVFVCSPPDLWKRRFVWVCVFQTSELRRRLMRAEADVLHTWEPQNHRSV